MYYRSDYDVCFSSSVNDFRKRNSAPIKKSTMKLFSYSDLDLVKESKRFRFFDFPSSFHNYDGSKTGIFTQ